MFIAAAKRVGVNIFSIFFFFFFTHISSPQVVRKRAQSMLLLDRPQSLTALTEIDIKAREIQQTLLAGRHN